MVNVKFNEYEFAGIALNCFPKRDEDLGDRDIRPATKSDMSRFGSSFSLAYIKIIPFSRGIRIFRSPG